MTSESSTRACGAGDPDDHEEVLVDRDHADGAAVTGEAAQRVGEGVDVGQHVVGQLLDLPHALLAVGGQGEVDSVQLLGHDVHTPLSSSALSGHSRVTDSLAPDGY